MAAKSAIVRGRVLKMIELPKVMLEWLKELNSWGPLRVTSVLMTLLEKIPLEQHAKIEANLRGQSYEPKDDIAEKISLQGDSKNAEKSSRTGGSRRHRKRKSAPDVVTLTHERFGPILNEVGSSKEARGRQLELLRSLLKQRIIDMRDPEDKALLARKLYTAASLNDVKTIKYCLEWGADVNFCPDPEIKDTALHIACYWNKVASVDVLLSYPGINLAQQDAAGDTALDVAKHFGHKELVVKLAQAASEDVAKHLAVWEPKPISGSLDTTPVTFPKPWHAGQRPTTPRTRYKLEHNSLSDDERIRLREYWEGLEAKRPKGIRGEPSALESMQLQHHADRVKDWFQSLSHAQKSFVQQLKYRAKKRLPKAEVAICYDF